MLVQAEIELKEDEKLQKAIAAELKKGKMIPKEVDIEEFNKALAKMNENEST